MGLNFLIITKVAIIISYNYVSETRHANPLLHFEILNYDKFFFAVYHKPSISLLEKCYQIVLTNILLSFLKNRAVK